MALGLLTAGVRVVAVDIDEAAFESLLEQARNDATDSALAVVATDITRDDSAGAIVATALARFGRLDILVSNAGVNLESLLGPDREVPTKFWDIAHADFRRVTEVNALAPFFMIRAAVHPMLKQGWGRIIVVSTSLDTMFRKGQIPYGGSKAATEAHASAMAEDLTGTGVTLNVLVPGGMVKSRMTVSASARFAGALFEPEIMVDPLLWLTSSDADDFTGRRIIAARWDTALTPAESSERSSAPIAWPQVGPQAIFPTT